MLAASPAGARTGNDLIEACRGALGHQKVDAEEAFSEGVCMGTIAAVVELGPYALKSICPPPKATNF
jgi:hypothetical protein